MKKFQILLTDGLQQPGKDILSSEGEYKDQKGISAEDLLVDIPNYDAIIVRGRTKVTSEVITKAAKLRVIGRCGVGVDNIDLKAAKEKGITVVNAPVATSTSVAELTMGMIFSLARDIPRATAGLKDGEWLKKSLIGVELFGKTLGIIGYGNIGAKVGHLAASAGMKIKVFDVLLKPGSREIENGEITTFESVLRESDFLTIHTPLVEGTRHLLNEKTFSEMKDGMRIVCAARGGIIDEQALLKALSSGKVAGAALDVFETEPPTFQELVDHPGVIATPHIGGQTRDAQLQASIDIASEVMAALKKEDLRWKIV